jgi:hypothetical protein
MKKLFSICLSLFLSVLCNAQENSKPKYNELNQDQLNLALTKSEKTVKTGKILTFVGLGVESSGIAILIYAGSKSLLDGSDNSNLATAGLCLFGAGGISMLSGIPVWISGANKKHEITLEMLKFHPPGSASINGIGIKVRF